MRSKIPPFNKKIIPGLSKLENTYVCLFVHYTMNVNTKPSSPRHSGHHYFIVVTELTLSFEIFQNTLSSVLFSSRKTPVPTYCVRDCVSPPEIIVVFLCCVLSVLEFVFSLDSSDAFLKNRVLNLPESLVEGTSYSQEQFLRRLARFRESNVEDETVLNYFEELDIHPEHIGKY